MRKWVGVNVKIYVTGSGFVRKVFSLVNKRWVGL